MKTFAFLTVLLVACGPEPSFPVRPPAAPVWPPAARKLAALAGKKAIDCGTAVDRNSADRVYECAATALARRRPFYCRYSPPSPPIVDDTGHSFPGIDVSPARIGGVWAWATAFVGTSAGVVYAVNQSSFSLGPPLLIPGATPPPRRLGVGMTVPVPVSTATAVLPPRTAYVSGLVIVEAIIDADGSVSQTRVLKPLPEQVGAAAEALVRRTMFRPSRFFGVAVPVLYNVSVDVRDAKATVR